jgi:acetyl esterase/lipase
MSATLSPIVIDPALLDPAAIDPETTRLNEEIKRRVEAEPTGLTFPQMRERRKQGFGAFPVLPRSPRAETFTIPGPGGPLELRMVAPAKPRGIYFHIHGGGWSIGTNDQLDPVFERHADNCGMACVSVDYRLAPEHPYPAGPDDCEAAALWILNEGVKRFGTSKLAIGGESAGGHLSVVTLLRLRDKHKLTPFSAAILNYGCYDMNMTPSARRWGTEKLVLNTPAIVAFAKSFLPEGTDRNNPDISPIFADLKGMPPAIFVVGTRDALIDDSLFMAPRWLAAGNVAELSIHPGACHGFISLPSKVRDQALDRIEAFFRKYV